MYGEITELTILFYGGTAIRSAVTSRGELYLLASDFGKDILGLSNPGHLLSNLEPGFKKKVKLSFEEHLNPQNYVLVNRYGVMSMLFRAKQPRVSRKDFLDWFLQTEKESTLHKRVPSSSSY